MKKATLGLLVAIALSTTACGNKGDAVDNMANAEANASDNLFDTTQAETEATLEGSTDTVSDTPTDVPAETDENGNPIIVEEKQSVGKAIISNSDETTARSIVPIKDTDLGEWTKTKKGFMFKSKETGDYIKASVMTLDGTVYFFDSDGILQDNIFVPDGSGRTYYIQNYQYVYGLVKNGDKTYYIDKDKGRLELCKVRIGNELYCFDEDGVAIKESDWDRKYSTLEETEGLAEESESAQQETTDETTETVSTDTETKANISETASTETTVLTE